MQNALKSINRVEDNCTLLSKVWKGDKKFPEFRNINRFTGKHFSNNYFEQYEKFYNKPTKLEWKKSLNSSIVDHGFLWTL